MAAKRIPIRKRDAEERREQDYITPRVDVYEDDDAVVLKADMPGVPSDGVEVKVENGVLSITGKAGAPPEEAELLYCEYELGDYHRSFNLPDDIDAEGITAEMSDGVLTVRLPRSGEARTRKIPVKAG